MRDELAGDHIAADFPECPSALRVSAGPLGSFGVGKKIILSTSWIRSFEGLDTVDEQPAVPFEADFGTVLATLRAKAARAERDPEYAAELEWVAGAGLDEDLGEGDVLGEDGDWSAYEAAEFEARLATMAERACCQEPWTDPRHRLPPQSPPRPPAPSHLEDANAASPLSDDVTPLTRASDRIRVVVSFRHDLDARSSAIGALRGHAEDGDADAAALLGSCHEHHGDPEHALAWYLQSHYGGSPWGTAALARISYDQGAKDQAARLMSAAWNADTVVIRRVFDLMDSSRAAKHPPARAAGPPETVRGVIDKIRASLDRIPPVLPAASFDARVWKAAGAHVLVFRRSGELLGDMHPFLAGATPHQHQPYTPTTDGVEPSSGDPGAVAARPPDPLTGITAENHRLADDVRRLEEAFGLPPGGDDRPPRRRAASGT